MGNHHSPSPKVTLDQLPLSTWATHMRTYPRRFTGHHGNAPLIDRSQAKLVTAPVRIVSNGIGRASLIVRAKAVVDGRGKSGRYVRTDDGYYWFDQEPEMYATSYLPTFPDDQKAFIADAVKDVEEAYRVLKPDDVRIIEGDERWWGKIEAAIAALAAHRLSVKIVVDVHRVTVTIQQEPWRDDADYVVSVGYCSFPDSLVEPIHIWRALENAEWTKIVEDLAIPA